MRKIANRSSPARRSMRRSSRCLMRKMFVSKQRHRWNKKGGKLSATSWCHAEIVIHYLLRQQIAHGHVVFVGDGASQTRKILQIIIVKFNLSKWSKGWFELSNAPESHKQPLWRRLAPIHAWRNCYHSIYLSIDVYTSWQRQNYASMKQLTREEASSCR